MHIEIDSQTEELLEKLGAKDAEAKAELARRRLLEALENDATGAQDWLELPEEKREAIGAKLVREAEEDGSCELTDADWDRILHGPVTEEELDKPFGAAVPPEWQGRTPRELREAKGRGLL